MISKLANDSLRLDQLKPGQAKHGFTRIMTRADGDLSTADASTYKDKFRAGQVRTFNLKSSVTHLRYLFV